MHRWNASRAVVIAIAEKTAQVIDVFDVVIDVTRCMYPVYLIEVGKKELSTIDYLDQIIKRKPKCFKNHCESPQYFTVFNRNFLYPQL